jgi:hypothetical protein
MMVLKNDDTPQWQAVSIIPLAIDISLLRTTANVMGSTLGI